MDQNSLSNMTPEKALISSRIMWAALVGGQVIFLIVIIAMQGRLSGTPDPQMVATLHYISIGMVIAAVPVGMFIRSQMYKKFWVGNKVTPQGYLQGNLLLWAMCEGTSLFGLVVTMLADGFWPWVVPSALAMAVQVMNWPDGAPMRPAEPQLPRRE